MRNFAVSSPLLVSLVLSACGSGGGGSGSGEEITIAYVDNKITNEMPPPGSYTATGTVLVCDDGYQGNSIDIGRVILSKINSSSTGETLALAFSYKLSATPADGTFTAFYIDTDNQPATGKAVTGSDGVAIGADVLDPLGSKEC